MFRYCVREEKVKKLTAGWLRTTLLSQQIAKAFIRFYPQYLELFSKD